MLSNWALSPDGRQVVVEITGKASGGIKVISLDNSEARELLGPDWEEKTRTLAWSSDGTYIFLFAYQDGESKPLASELWRMGVQGGQPEKLQTFERLPVIRMRIHPSGKHVALVTHEGLFELWVMESFLPAGQ
jgi:WD40 repeat protein